MALHPSSPNIGLWSSLASAATARLLVSVRPDWVTLDAQHGAWTAASVSDVLPALAAASTGDVPVWVRVPDDRPATIGRALDAGAAGVIVPMIDTPEQAAAAAAACRYPPRGRRSFGPMLPLVGRTAPMPADADDAVRCAVMVETAAALERVDDIAAAPGVDMVFLGPFDLGLALNRSVDDLLTDGDDLAPLPSVVRACRRADVRAGGFAGTPARARRMVELGFTDVVVATDAGLLSGGAEAALDAFTRAPAPDRAIDGY
ncbi:4-hydroxy-2-oxoheptanedioate aldolase [Quadrisphaera granulorum]|uniref:4-hydroxy-2-oxoheptanedioate aldolase n=1 Tax=Quadrisphaera granulorum TaxID=317664 RepID=A0A316ARM8_9ACTN|nr:aldolase/citrate lyase family protein [Quadrisphaera granulorum]PWJ52757.1 4-hydroxy-2-oxoheptanedioate aldolase [Quadrisphaera granulorum]SZE97362.1 4-hydroxy-2-oxoheptanedioate aldolase [Quadrisphaera granulorum]